MQIDAIVFHDLRARLRRGLTYFLLTTLIALNAALALIAYWLITSQPALAVPTIGATAAAPAGPLSGVLKAVWASRATLLFLMLGVSQVLALLVIAPALAGGSIAGERERRTYDLLATTVGPRRIAFGKLFAAVLSAGLVVGTSLPVFGLVALMGPIGPADIGSLLVVLLSTAALFSAVGVFCSTWVSSAFLAAALGYASVFLLFVASGSALVARAAGGDVVLLYVASLNPVVSVLSVVGQIDPQALRSLPDSVSNTVGEVVVLTVWPAARLPIWAFGSLISLAGAVLLTLMSARLLATAREPIWRAARRPSPQAERS